MIAVTRLNGSPVIVNAELIKLVEATPDTMITLVNGERMLVTESVKEIVKRAIDYGRSIRVFQT